MVDVSRSINCFSVGKKWLKIALLGESEAHDSETPLEGIRCQFHQHSLSSFCACRSRKCRKIQFIDSFCACRAQKRKNTVKLSVFRDMHAQKLHINMLVKFTPAVVGGVPSTVMEDGKQKRDRTNNNRNSSNNNNNSNII